MLGYFHTGKGEKKGREEEKRGLTVRQSLGQIDRRTGSHNVLRVGYYLMYSFRVFALLAPLVIQGKAQFFLKIISPLGVIKNGDLY